MNELRGWLLDVHSHPQDEVVVWLVGEDGGRHRLRQHMPISFYASGPASDLRELWRFLRRQPISCRLARQTQEDLYGEQHDCLAVEVPNAAQQRRLFRAAQRAFPDLDYYNADIAIPIHFNTRHGIFPLAYCRMLVDGDRIQQVEVLDSAWELEDRKPPLRVLHIEPECRPELRLPRHINVSMGSGIEFTVSTGDSRELVLSISRIIDDFDPDIISCTYGDKWFFPYIFKLAKEHKLAFNPNREKSQRPIQVEANTFTSYGRIMQRDQQTLLFGRAHLDKKNSMAFKDFDLAGTRELARVTGLPLQNAARRSAGGGFTAMQVQAALQRKVLLPLNRKRHERYKSAAELLVADNGGLIFQPLTGLHDNVAEIDFFSMYPSLMHEWNISPETVNVRGDQQNDVPVLNRPITKERRGLVASVLQPVLDKRREAKKKLRESDPLDKNRGYYQIVTDTLKWLGWVSFGYQGFSGNRIGSIEAHEAINGVSRELLLRAKEAAEDHGFTVVHMYVDSLFVRKEGATRPEDFTSLIEDMEQRTGLYLELSEFFHWIAFLTSKTDRNLPVPNCYFGAYEEKEQLEIKTRGVMMRRSDSPAYVAGCQEAAIRAMARLKTRDSLAADLPKLIHLLRAQYQRLNDGQLTLEQLAIRQTLSRDPQDFKVLSAAGRAAQQLIAAGKQPRAGKQVAYLRTVGDPDVLAWDLINEDSCIHIDYAWYQESFLRAAHELVESFGITKEELKRWLESNESYFAPQDFTDGVKSELPLFS